MLAGILAALGPAAAAAPLDPLKLYGGDMDFTVWREGSKIGEHRMTFAQDGGALVVRSFLELAVKVLGITIYRFKFQSEERWRDGALDHLTSTKDDNGTTVTVEAKTVDGKIVVTGPKGQETVTPPILPSSHWNAAVIAADRVINTLDGTISRIKLEPLGEDSVPVGAAARHAMHYRYTGDIKAESWYDADGHWLKLRFPGTDGSLIDYVCVRCMAGP